jgi:phosphatidylglycerol:prolipoprotein diacylglycerol transferase
MRQILFEVPWIGVKIFGYGLMLFFAFLGAMNLAAWRARREKLDPELVYDMALYVFIGGLVGARGFYVLEYWGRPGVNSFWEIFEIWKGGIVLYGSVLGGTIGFLIYRGRRWFPVLAMLDAIAPALAVGVAIGRFGCFLNGCCYGDTCSLPWAVRFPSQSPPWNAEVTQNLIRPDAAWSLWLHPTQLYSTVDGLILFLLVSAYYPLRRRDGEVMGLLLLTYPITRFLIEHLRNDEGIFLAGMTVSQVISVGLLGFAAVYWFALSRSPAIRWADAAHADPERPAKQVGATV